MKHDDVPNWQRPRLAAVGCPLCDCVGGVLVAQRSRCRVIRAEEPAFPAFYRVVWTEHVAEFSDLDAGARAEIMEVVCEVERVLRSALQPTKVNLASLGNVVAHLHWHVIARFEYDTHFPQPVWASAVRAPEPGRTLPLSLEELDRRVFDALRRACW